MGDGKHKLPIQSILLTENAAEPACLKNAAQSTVNLYVTAFISIQSLSKLQTQHNI